MITVVPPSMTGMIPRDGKLGFGSYPSWYLLLFGVSVSPKGYQLSHLLV